MDDEFEAFIESQKAQLAQERKELLKEPNTRKKWDIPVDSVKNEDPASQDFMPPSDIEQRRKALQMERKMEYNEMIAKRNGFKENLPPKPPTPDVGLVSKLGAYSEKRQRLQEERKREYNRMLAEQRTKQSSKHIPSAPSSGQPMSQGNPQRDGDRDEQWMEGVPGPPRKGWATPTYEEILERKRKQERNYRRMEDPYDRSNSLASAGYNRTSVSEDNLRRHFQEEKEKLAMLDQEFERKKVRFLDNQRPSSNPGEQLSNPNDSFLNQFHTEPNSQPSMPLFTRQNLRKIGSEPENFNATLMIGQEMSSSRDRQRKGAYREELKQQMEESKARKLRERTEAQKGQDGIMDRTNPAQSSGLVTPFPAHHPYGMQPTIPADDMGLGHGLYQNRPNIHNPDTSGILGNGFDFNRSPASNIPGNRTGLIPSLNPYNSPVSDAYFYYGMQNPLDPNLAFGMPQIPSYLQPPLQTGMPLSLPPFPAPVQDMTHQVTSLPRQQVTSTFGPGQNLPPSGAHQRSQNPAGLPGEDLGERKRAEDEKKKMYQMELQRQMEEDKLKKQKKKEEQEKYDKKLEAEIANYSPYGQPGGGAPLRDRFGNVITARKPEAVTQANSQNTPRAADYQVGSLMDPNPYTASGNPYLSLYKSPLLDAEQPTFLRGEDPKAAVKKSPRSEDELRFARGGNGIFGEPMTSEQKNVKQRYQDELRKQIEEKKKREEEEKKRLQQEEELLMKRIEEDNLRIKKEQEEEKKKQREKAEEAERQQQEFKRQQDEQRQEAEKKKREANEARQQELKQKEEENKKAEQMARVKSPPVPTIAHSHKAGQSNSGSTTYRKNSQPQNPSPDPADRSKSQQSRLGSAKALGHLAKMKEKLNYERKRVESDLKKEKMPPEVYDPRLVARRPSLRNDSTALKGAKQGTANKPARQHDEFPQRYDDLNTTIKPDDNFKDHRPIPKSPANDGLEDWQQSRLMQQKEELKRLKRRQPNEHDLSDDGSSSRPDSNLLEAETKFVAIPGSKDSAQGDCSIPDDISDFPKRASASNRRHRRVTISDEPDSPAPLNRVDSVISLDPEELKRKNEERMKKLKSLEGDDISGSQADDVLKHFMAKRKQLTRPPSSNTLMDDSWMRPGSGH